MSQPSFDRHRRLGLALSALLFLAWQLPTPEAPPTAPSPEDELRGWLEKVRQEVGAPGAVLGVQGAGEPLVVAAGLADRETGRIMATDNPNQLGSISKTYTAVVVLRLAEQGRLSLDDRVARFLPAFPRGGEITIRHLIEQTSGLKDFYMHLYYRPDREEMIRLVTKDWREEELLELAGRFGHWSEPGAEWSYCNANYYLLAVIAERAGGLKLPEAYRHHIYQPLGLERTWLTWHEQARGILPVGYLGKVEEWKHSEMFGELGATTVLDHSPVEYGAGGLAAPAADSLRFLRALFRGQLLEAKSLDAMRSFRPIAPLGVTKKSDEPPQETDGYGMGLIRMERGGHTLVGHGGLFTGHTAGLWQIPECDLTLSLYFNRGFVDQRAVLDQLVPLLTRDRRFGAHCPPAAPPKP